MKSAASRSRTTVMIYGAAIVVLLALVYPYTWWLDQVRREKDLGEATIGQVDTGSFMLKLALLGGARGVAANVLWTRAIDLQKVQEWDRLKSTVDLITKLQPHFLAVWTFQSWNLAYNVSVEWDAPEDKYEWIKKGIQFIEDGVNKNQKSPDLVWDTASTYYHKLGFSDEAVILRRLFRDDTDDAFKTDPMTHEPRDDNFQVAHGWFTKAVDLVDQGESRVQTQIEAPVSYVDPPPQRKGRPGDLAFRSMPPHAQTRYALSLEKQSILGVEATFGEVARNEWAKARNEWVEFGSYPYLSYNAVERDGKMVRDSIKLDDATNLELFKKMPENAQYWTNRWADQMNYPYWKDRCSAEMEREGVQARKHFYDGTKAFRAGDYPEAGKQFKEGLVIWDGVLKKHATYRNDDLNKRDTGLIVKRYSRVLANLGEQMPDDTPFKDLLRSAEQDVSVDPFDALEVRTTTRSD